MKTLNLKEAAAFLHVHPDTLQGRAKAGEVPGAKIGRAWSFIDDDLADYIRAKYPANGGKKCHPTNVKGCINPKAQANTLSESRTTENEYLNLLAPTTKN